jgi:nitroreductase
MSIESPLESKLEAILELARFAPSVHNTQPWMVTLHDKTITVSIDPAHKLQDGDPTGRETIISLGIFAEALQIAAAYQGFRSMDIQVHNDGRAAPAPLHRSQHLYSRLDF